MKKTVRHLARGRMRASARQDNREAVGLPVQMKSRYVVECRGPDGGLKWREDTGNLVVNAGLDDLLDKRFKASSYTASDFVGLTDGTPSFAGGDTMASHVGWAEVTDYAGSPVRPAFVPGSVSGQSLDNSGSPAVFEIDDTVTIGGAFLATDDEAGGTAGILYGGAAFSADRSAGDGDTLTVTVFLTTAAA